MKETKKNIPLGIIMSIVPVLVFFAASLLVSLIVQMFYTPQLVVEAQKYADPTALLSNQEWLTEQLMASSYPAVSTLIGDGLMALIAFFWWKKSLREKEIMVNKAFSPKIFGFLALVGIAIQGCLNALLSVVFAALPESITESYAELSEGLLGSGSTSLTMALAVVIAAPICEDLVFRGLVLNYGRKYIGDKAAIVISSVIFGLFHLSNLSLSSLSGVMVQVVYAAVIGLILGIIATRFRTVWAAVFVHFIVNGSGQIVSLIAGKASNPDAVGYVLIGVGVIALAGAILMYRFKQAVPSDAETIGEIKAAEIAANTVGENAEN